MQCVVDEVKSQTYTICLKKKNSKENCEKNWKETDYQKMLSTVLENRD